MVHSCSVVGPTIDWLTNQLKKNLFAGTIGVVDISRFASYGYDQRLEAFGPGGMLQVDNDKPNSSIHYTNTGISQYVILCS